MYLEYKTLGDTRCKIRLNTPHVAPLGTHLGIPGPVPMKEGQQCEYNYIKRLWAPAIIRSVKPAGCVIAYQPPRVGGIAEPRWAELHFADFKDRSIPTATLAMPGTYLHQLTPNYLSNYESLVEAKAPADAKSQEAVQRPHPPMGLGIPLLSGPPGIPGVNHKPELVPFSALPKADAAPVESSGGGIKPPVAHEVKASIAGLGVRAPRTESKPEAPSVYCVICLEREKDCMIDCMHGVMCMECATSVQACPTCRAPITSRKKYFFG